MCSNCELRSGCDAPSRVLRTDRRLYPSSCSFTPTLVGLIVKPCSRIAAESFTLLLQVQRSGDSGSPRVTGSTRRSSASRIPGCFSSSDGRPAPGRRIRSPRSSPDSSSLLPARIVIREIPVADDTSDSPPNPRLCASTAAHRRRARSSSTGASASNFSRTAASVSLSRLTPTVDHTLSRSVYLNLARRLRGLTIPTGAHYDVTLWPSGQFGDTSNYWLTRTVTESGPGLDAHTTTYWYQGPTWRSNWFDQTQESRGFARCWWQDTADGIVHSVWWEVGSHAFTGVAAQRESGLQTVAGVQNTPPSYDSVF